MDNRIITLFIAMGISPTVITHEANAIMRKNSSRLSISIDHLQLHYGTKLIIQKLKECNALSLIDNEHGAQLVIHGDKLDDEFFRFLSGFKNVKPTEDGRDLIVSDLVAAVLSKFGELNNLAISSRDEVLIQELQEKMSTHLDKVLMEGPGQSFA